MTKRQKIFIPFIDGLLNYNCQECGYVCCQDGTIIMNIKEKMKLLQTYPILRYCFSSETKKTYAIRKYTRCWFLEKNGLCYIQKKYGYSYKPFVCRSHPFYIAKCKDEYVMIIDLCPTLHVGKEKKGVSHKQILKNAKEAINNNIINGEINWSKKRVDLEKKILEGSKKFLNNSNYLDFSIYQILITTKNKNIAKIKSKLLESINLWKSFLEVDKLNIENKGLTYELTAITSLLRLESLRLRDMQAKRVPLALLALYFYMLLFAKNRRTRTYLITYQEILSDIPLGLLYLVNDDLKIKNISIEGKIIYLRQLQMLHMRNERNTIQNL